MLELLQAADDFMTLHQVAEALQMTTRRASSALHNLYLAHAIDVVEAPDTLWWFATPEEDRRTRVPRERGEYTRNERHRTVRGRRRANEKPRRD